jgi:hypothetical protein
MLVLHLVCESADLNKALQLTANPLRGLSAAELGRYAERYVLARFELPC